MNEKLYQIALELIPGIGDKTVKHLISYCGSASAVFSSRPPHLLKIPGIGEHAIRLLKTAEPLNEAELILKRAEQKGISVHHYTDKTYPEKLKQIFDAPNIVYSKGHLPQWDRILAIVGTRNATSYGREITEKIVAESRSINAVIVSGLAYGIDITAHRAALQNALPTIAVLAGGIDRIYPSAHKKTAEELQETGALISENPPGIQAEAHFFPARNRIIAGMSDAVIVVEAAKRGGALITANIADSYNKPVFAVPGTLKDNFSEGCNYLIRNQKAYIYTGIEDLKYHLNWDAQTKGQPTVRDTSTLGEAEKTLYRVLLENDHGLAIDELAWRSQIPVNQMASHLLNMEFQGFVKSLPGKKYKAC